MISAGVAVNVCFAATGNEQRTSNVRRRYRGYRKYLPIVRKHPNRNVKSRYRQEDIHEGLFFFCWEISFNAEAEAHVEKVKLLFSLRRLISEDYIRFLFLFFKEKINVTTFKKGKLEKQVRLFWQSIHVIDSFSNQFVSLLIFIYLVRSSGSQRS